MRTIREFCDDLESFAPLHLAEEWDNVGLLVGYRDREVKKVMVTLTVTAESASEAIAEHVDLVVTHHPIPFRPLSQLTDDTTVGRLLLDLIGSRVAIYSPHTAFDSAAEGINQQLALGLRVTDPRPLIAAEGDDPELGAGRFGPLPNSLPLSEIAAQVRTFLHVDHVRVVGDLRRPIETVAVACGSAGEFLEAARQNQCDLLVTGETSFHTCLEAQATQVGLLLTGHFASERFAVESLAQRLASRFPEVDIWASRRETDPLVWV